MKTTILILTFFLGSAQAAVFECTSTQEQDLRIILEKAKSITTEPVEIQLAANINLTNTLEIWSSNPHSFTLTGSADVTLNGSSCPKGADTLAMNGKNIIIQNLHITHSQGNSLRLAASGKYLIKNCQFTHSQGGGIIIWNEQPSPRADSTLERIISNNLIEHFNLANVQWSHDGMSIQDDDTLIQNNTVKNCTAECMGIRVMGRNNQISQNIVTSVGHADSGGIYLWGGKNIYHYLGNIVKNNIISKVSRGIYLDDGTSGALIEHNWIDQAQVAGIFIGGGRDNTIIQNIISQSPIGIHLDTRTAGWDTGPDKMILWTQAYQQLTHLLSDLTAAPLLKKRFPQFNATLPTIQDYIKPFKNIIIENKLYQVTQDQFFQDYSVHTQLADKMHLYNQLEPSIQLTQLPKESDFLTHP
jgi:hypothetical protein